MTPPVPVPPPDDEFYIGYDPPMPARMAARVSRVVLALVTVVLGMAVAALTAHHRLTPAAFDFGQPQALRGHLARTPYPELVMDGRRALLVGRGKHGAEHALAGIPDGPVMLSGTRIERGGHRMFEVVPGSAGSADKAAPELPAPPAPDAQAPVAADVTLRGEIVDSKCFLGVMNPGEGTVHRDCARVCLRGGIPPMLLVRGGHAEERLVLLVDATGAAIGRDLADLAGVPVEVRGRLSRDGERLVLSTSRHRVVPLPVP